MKYEELKEKILDATLCISSVTLQKCVCNIFEQYEKENQASEKTDIEKEIFELSCFRKKFGECLDDQRNDLNLLKKHILDLQDELGTLKRDLKFEAEQEKPKQERFTFREYKGLDTINKIYDVLDSKNKLYFRTLFEYTQAKDVCENLNSLAKGE